MENKETQIQIELPADVAEGTYSNLALIAHSQSEFVLDFVAVMPGLPKAKVKSRIVLAPEHAKRLMTALEENVSRYEHQFGKIDIVRKSAFGIEPTNSAFGGGQA